MVEACEGEEDRRWFGGILRDIVLLLYYAEDGKIVVYLQG